MGFACPWAFLLFLPWLAAAWRMLRRARMRGAPFAGASARFAGERPTWRQRLCAVLPIVFLLGAAALIVGAAGPRTTLGRQTRTADALAVMMAVDVSGSMEGLDLSEGRLDKTRLDVVKAQFRDFVEARPDDLIGLVAFGGYASVRAPLTADHGALLHVLSGLEIPRETEDEALTAIGDGLSVALLRLKDAEPSTKIVILLSDGVNNVGAVSPTQAAEAAKAQGVRVYTIGVGSNGPVPVRRRDVFGRERVFTVGMELDEATLRAIAETTGGRYANVRSPDALHAALDEISALETTRVERQTYLRHESHARPFLLAGGALCLLSALGLVIFLRRPL